jgi:hypothetical protein
MSVVSNGAAPRGCGYAEPLSLALDVQKVMIRGSNHRELLYDS